MTAPDTSSMFDKIVTDACVELFRAFGVTLLPLRADVSEPDPTAQTAGVVTFAGPDARGTLVLATSFEVIANCIPEGLGVQLTSSTPGAWTTARDCTKELVNQLLGRIKNRLRIQGIQFEARTPTVITGHAVASVLNARTTKPYRFTVAGKPVAVWFDAVVTGGLKRPSDGAPLWEGDVSMNPPPAAHSSSSPPSSSKMLAAKSKAPPSKAPPSKGPPPSRRNDVQKKVLIIDDSLIVRQQVKAALGSAGYTMLEAGSGLEGLKTIESTDDLGLIICDVNMPGLDGLALLEQVAGRGILSRCPFVMLTSEAQPEAVARARALGLRAWMVKPVRSETLIGVVKRLVG